MIAASDVVWPAPRRVRVRRRRRATAAATSTTPRTGTPRSPGSTSSRRPRVDPRHPWIENAATRILPRFTALFEAKRFDQTEALLADDFRRVDRRSTVSSRDIGKAEYLEWHRSLYEIFDTVTFQPLAVRGERLSLVRITAAREGFETVSLALARLDEEGLIAELVHFDEADLAAAQDELDERFIAGEGAPYVELLRAGKALTEAYVAKDTAAVATMRAPGFTFIDHRRFGWEGPERLAAFDDLDESFLVTKYLLRSNSMLASVVNRGVDPRGNDAEWLLHIVTAVDGENRFSSTDWYDAEDWDAALARFDELVSEPLADPRHPRAENAMTRLNDRFVMLVEAGRTAEAGMVADDYVRVDRRSTVAAPDTSGSGEYADALAAALDVGFTSYRVTPIAVRGEQLALSRVVMTTNDGFDMRFLVFDEMGDDGRALRSVYFDDDDLVTAFEALELRHRELSGDAYSEVERFYVDRFLAFNRGDMDLGFASLAPDFQMVDHGPMGFGTTDAEGQPRPDGGVCNPGGHARPVSGQALRLAVCGHLGRADPRRLRRAQRHRLAVRHRRVLRPRRSCRRRPQLPDRAVGRGAGAVRRVVRGRRARSRASGGARERRGPGAGATGDVFAARDWDRLAELTPMTPSTMTGGSA